MALFDFSLPDVLAVSDSVETLLESYEPKIEDTAAASDSIALELDYHVELGDDAEVSDSIAFEKSQVPNEIHVELEDAIEVSDYLEALLFDGQVHTVTSVTPERGRSGDTITIVGTGFAASNNNVRLDGTACTIVSQSTTQIVITQPTTLNVTEGFAELQVSNFDNNRVTTVPFWIKAPISTLETRSLPDQTPGVEEYSATTDPTTADGTMISEPTRAEARDWERMATVVDFLLTDSLTALGDMFTHDGTGLAELDGSAATPVLAGSKLVADSSQTEGLRWGHQFNGDLPFGYEIPSGTTTGVNMVANGNNASTTGGTTWVAGLAGELDAVYVYQHSSGGNTDRLDRVRILIDGVQQYDSGTGLAIAHQGKHFAGSLGISVSVGSRIQVEITKTGTNAVMNCLGAVRMLST